MALDINGYNSAFKSFVEFAQNRTGENQEKAVADARIKKFNGEEVLTIAHVKTDEVHKWLRTVDVFGNVTSTPMKFDQPVAQLTAKAARAKVDAAANGLDVTLTSAQANEAAGLLRTHGTDMYSWNADIFAKFLVRLVTAGGHGVNKAAIAADTAKCIRKWRNVNFGDAGIAAFNEAAKNYASNTIRKFMQPRNDGKFKDGIHDTMLTDAPRSVYILNGTTYNHRPVDEVIPAFKDLVPDLKKRRALSTYLNQLCFETILFPSNHTTVREAPTPQLLTGFATSHIPVTSVVIPTASKSHGQRSATTSTRSVP